jgi:hypothetical protein
LSAALPAGSQSLNDQLRSDVLKSEKTINRWGLAITGRARREFIQQRDENDDFPTVACDLR